MSNTLGRNLINVIFCRRNSLDNQTRASSGISGNYLPHAPASKTSLQLKKSLFPIKFSEHLRLKKGKVSKEAKHIPPVVPCAVLAMDPSPGLAGKFKLEGNSELMIDVTNPTTPTHSQINFQVTNNKNSLMLHWGGIRDGQKNWILPSRKPDGTKVYKNQALRTPFKRLGSDSFLKIEIDSHEIQAIEFLIFDETQNKWLKNNGGNFCVKLLRKDDSSLNISVPEDLVQIQAYLRWERKGKQKYTPEQQKMEFEEARKDLQFEIEKGSSLEEIRKKITKGNKVSKQVPKRYSTPSRIQRRQRDAMQLLNVYVPKSIEQKPSHLSPVELFSKAKEENADGYILNKQIFKLGDKILLVLVTKPLGKIKVHLATDLSGPLTLHWALSKRPGEWQAPPLTLAPQGSVMLQSASETQFTDSSSNDPHQVQLLEISIGEENYVGMPFVLRSGRNWIKNGGSDFYVEFNPADKFRKDVSDGKDIAKPLLEKIAQMEKEAQKSFMHRFNIAADLMGWAKDFGEVGFAGIFVWMRFMATRQLVWNKNYNVKPREISKAKDRLTDLLQDTYISGPQYRELLRMIMATVGRGGEGDVGQRIRDEILVIQRNNDCNGGMMEEWHQKLHNNTSPDDVVICQALIDYIKSDFDVSAYWKTLHSNGITKERLLSYDRAIHSEPDLRREHKDGLLRDLGNYMRTLKAVHSGADLESSVANCLGYKAEGQGFMVGVSVSPVSGLPTGFPELLQFVLDHVEDKNIELLLEGLLEAREELRPLLLKPHNRLKDLLFLDIALDSTVRTVIERGYEELNNAGAEKIMWFITLVVENLALSSDNNEDLIYCLKGWNHALTMSKSGDDWPLYAKSVLDRTRLALASKAEHYNQILQPSAEYLGSLLGVDQWAVKIFTEEVIRSGSAASLSALLNRLDPVLRKIANLGSWQVISPVEAIGYVVVVDELLAVQNKSYEKPTILVARNVKGEEEIPDGTVAVLTPDMPDVLSHVSVRARNSKVCFATCFDPAILNDLKEKEGKLLQLKPTSADIVYCEVKDSELLGASSMNFKDENLPSLTLVKKKFCGRFAVSAEEFTSEMVGAKSRNISYLKGKVPSWVGIPTSVALPFGVFEKILSDKSNQGVANAIQPLKKKLGGGDFTVLGEIRQTVLQLAAPPQMVKELKNTMLGAGMPWPGDEGEKRWEQAWTAIKKVWASKWNERAYFSTRRVKLDHDHLCMAVLIQEIINADYAFVIHTTNPSSGDSSEIYAEVVKGLGETLVGAYPGRALSFITKKNDLNSPKVLGYPSKPIGLFIKRSIIFRSDSNGEDLEGYAGAGLYDSVPMDEEEKVVLDYSTDPLVIDSNFRRSILSSIARAGKVIEDLYGSPQDIEGVVKDKKIYVVQTRPQM